MPLSPEDIAYLREAAARDGYNADDAMKTFQHESSLDPTRWGGKGNNYFGLFQAGLPERAKYGVDTVHPSARNQIDAFGRFLHDRGFKQGMGLKDMYSTVLAGSPGHYNRSDGAGTVAQHVARMQGQTPSSGGSASTPGLSLGGIPPEALAFTNTAPARPSAKPDPLADLILQTGVTQEKPKQNLTALVQSLLAEPDKPQKQADSTDDAFLRQMMDFHNAQHMRAIQGLL